MKNSPAACATLGMNVVRLKLSVFMMSAAIAGLGGCLFAQEIGAVTSDRFSLFESMTMLMLLVVAGAGYVSRRPDRGPALRRGRSSRSRTSSRRSATDFTAFHGLDRVARAVSPRCCRRSSVSGSAATRVVSSATRSSSTAR